MLKRSFFNIQAIFRMSSLSPFDSVVYSALLCMKLWQLEFGNQDENVQP